MVNNVDDNANRLISVDNVTYTWDNNGNLLSDGVNTYIYDTANHLISVTNTSGTVSYEYDGLGNRYQQTVNNVTTTYVLDLATGLTQVLEDGTDVYYYGLGRIAQEDGTEMEYFLGDALGSVRQMADENGNVTLAKDYDPYGNVLASLGAAESMYGYDAEQTDYYINLINLRSRQYSPSTGTFTTRDSWQGDYNRPLSLSRWNYVEGDPINHLDPTGHWVYSRFSETGTKNKWEDDEKALVDQMAGDVAKAYAATINSDVLYRLWDPCMGLSFPAFWEIYKVTPHQAFQMIHGGRILFEKHDEVADMGKTESREYIKFFRTKLVDRSAPDGYLTTGHYFFMSGYRRVITHEIGHAYDNAVDYYSGLLGNERKASADLSINLLRPPIYDDVGNQTGRYNCDPIERTNCYGYAGGKGQWQFGQGELGEEFADMFVGWTYNSWGDIDNLPPNSYYRNRQRDMNYLMVKSLTTIFRYRLKFNWLQYY